MIDDVFDEVLSSSEYVDSNLRKIKDFRLLFEGKDLISKSIGTLDLEVFSSSGLSGEDLELILHINDNDI